MATSTILVVEDDEDEQVALRQLLERFDYVVHVASSGEEALSAYALAPFAAILMDIGLSGMDGFECTRALRQLDAKGNLNTPIIALTGRSQPEDRARCVKAGMDDYLSKPVDPEQLRRVLLRWVYQSDQPNLKLLNSYTATSTEPGDSKSEDHQ